MADVLPKIGTNAEAGGDINQLANQQANGESQQNSVSKLLSAAGQFFNVISKANSPSSTNEADAFLVGASGSGDFAGFTEDELAVRIDAGWHVIAPYDGLAIRRQDLQNSIHVHDGTSWLEAPASVEDSITASATQTQGQQPLTARFNRISAITTNGDVVTLPAAYAGAQCVVWNDDQSGSNTLQIFPASGDSIDELSANTSISGIATGTVYHFFAINATQWCSITS